MSDKIAEIRERHSRDDRWRNTLPQMHEDRAFLLAEVDRLRAEIERLNKDLLAQNACCDGAAAQDAHIRRERMDHKAEVEKLRAENKRLRAANKQLVDGIDTITRRKQEEIERQRAEIERLRAALEYMVNVCPAIDPDGDRAHEQARKALEGKP